MKPFEPGDFLLASDIVGVHLSPDGLVAACEVRSCDKAQDCMQTRLWAVPADGRKPWPLTAGATRDTAPRWSPDGSELVFLSDRGNGLQQLQRLPIAGGEAQPLGEVAGGVVSFWWSPDASRLLVLSPVPVDPEARGGPHDQVPVRGPNAPQLIWRLPYKADGIGYLLDREFHLFAMDVATGIASQVTSGAFSVKTACWSPDGTQIAYTRSREGLFAHCTDLWICNADGANARQVSFDVQTAQFPHWSPDGRWIVFCGAEDAGDPQRKLWCYGVDSNVVSRVGDESLDIAAPEDLAWLPEGAEVLGVRAVRGRHEVCMVTIPDGEVTILVQGDRHIPHLSSAAGQLAYTVESLLTPCELYMRPLAGGGEQVLSDFNAWWRDKQLPRAQARQFEVPDGKGGSESIEGWLLLPDTQDIGSRPLYIDVHGGPASYAQLKFAAHPHWYVLASRGWAVLALNTVGSSSYGREFMTRLRAHWGEYDLEQVLAAVDALQHEGVVDERLAIGGGSYGGYLTAWAIGHTTRFRAAVVSAPVTNLETHYGTSDSGFYSDPYSMLGEPYIEREVSQRLSPMKSVERARTPTLILQGEKDERCPKCQAEELFVTLMCACGTPAELVMYPGAGHQLSLPSHKLDAFTRHIAWLEKWIDAPVPDCRHGPAVSVDHQPVAQT